MIEKLRCIVDTYPLLSLVKALHFLRCFGQASYRSRYFGIMTTLAVTHSNNTAITDIYECLPEAFCRTLLRAFSTPGAPDVVAERILIGSWAPGPHCSPWFLQLSEKERATAAAFWESWITPDMQRRIHAQYSGVGFSAFCYYSPNHMIV